MRILVTALVSLFFGLTTPLVAHSAENENLSDMSLEELMNVKVTVASKKALTTRESPGIVTVITSEQIRNSGARDLADILTMHVPGFQLSGDVEVVTGPALRGIYAIEGKILLLIDGIEVNDDVWGNIIFQNHYPADMIDHIEVIRGPGSAIYGNYASVGVISVTTKGGSLHGASAHVLNSQMSKAPSHRDITLGFGKQFSEDFNFNIMAATGEGNRSDADYANFFYTPMTQPDSYSMAHKFTTRPLFINGNLKFKGLDFRAIFDELRQGYPQTYDRGIGTDMQYSYMYDLKYTAKITDTFTLTPRYSYKIHKPYGIEEADLDPAQNFGKDSVQNHRDSKRSFYGLLAQWEPQQNLNIIGGAEYYQTTIYIPKDWFGRNLTDSGTAAPGGERFNRFEGPEYDNQNTAFYTQGTLNTDFANFTAGARYEKTLRFGDAFVPRVGLTKVVDSFHSKLMLTESFRTPLGIQEDNAIAPMKPEKAINTELELGYLVTPEFLVQGNIYDIQLKDLIMYQAGVGGGSSTYANVGSQRTQGAEAEVRYQGKIASLTANYAYYQNLAHAETNDVPGHRFTNVGLPQNRFNLIAGYRINDQWSIHPSATYSGIKYGWIWTDGNTDPTTGTIKELGSTWMVNLNIRARDILTKGLELNLGGHNLTNTKDFLPQAYAGYVNPLPVETRSWMIRLGYTAEM